MGDVSVVTVLYNSAAVIEQCLASIPEGVEVIVVDNASEDDGAERAGAARPDAIVIRSARNLGFGGGCNLGLLRARGRYVAFINPDVRLRERALFTLGERLAAEPHAIVGPAVLDASGVPRRLKLPASPLVDCLALLPASGRWARGHDGRLPADCEAQRHGGPVPLIEGACFVIRRADLEAIGGFDEDLFLYDEEESLAVRLANLGGRAVYEPAATVEHPGAHATEAVGALATRHAYRSRILLYRKRDGNARAWAAAAALMLAAFLSLPVAALNSALGRPRVQTLSHLGNVLRGIVAGLSAAARPYPGYRRSGTR